VPRNRRRREVAVDGFLVAPASFALSALVADVLGAVGALGALGAFEGDAELGVADGGAARAEETGGGNA